MIIFDLFQTETIEIQDKALQTTEFLNPKLPGAQIKDDGIGSKYENMAKSWGKIQDYSAVDNIDREEPDKNKEEYESKYTQDDIDLLTEEQQEKAAAAEIASAKTREQEALAELEKALAEARLRGQNATVPPAETDTGRRHGHERPAKNQLYQDHRDCRSQAGLGAHAFQRQERGTSHHSPGQRAYGTEQEVYRSCLERG